MNQFEEMLSRYGMKLKKTKDAKEMEWGKIFDALNKKEMSDKEKETYIVGNVLQQLMWTNGFFQIENLKQFGEKFELTFDSVRLPVSYTSKKLFMFNYNTFSLYTSKRLRKLSELREELHPDFEKMVDRVYPGYRVQKTFHPDEAEETAFKKVNEAFQNFAAIVETADLYLMKDEIIEIVANEFDSIHNVMNKIRMLQNT